MAVAGHVGPVHRPRNNSRVRCGLHDRKIHHVNLGQRLEQTGDDCFRVGQSLRNKSRRVSFDRKVAIPWMDIARPPMNFHTIADLVQLQAIAPYLAPAHQSQDALNATAVPAISQPI